jgi:DNA-binding MarR family transcriptional regulator
MYMTDPEIRRFPNEELEQARAKSHVASLTKGQYEILAAFFHDVRQYAHFSGSVAEVAGLTSHQCQALLAVKGFPNRQEVTIGELADQLQITHRSAVGLVNRLVEQNLVARKQSGEDRRQLSVELTGRGAEILEQLVRTHQRELRRLGPRLEVVLASLMRDHNE